MVEKDIKIAETMQFDKPNKIERIPKNCKEVTIKGYCLNGEGRGLGRRLMQLAEDLDCYSPGNNSIQGEEKLTLQIRHPDQPNKKLVDFLNYRIEGDCCVIFK